MGNLATGETLALRWAEVCRDASLRNLPYKIELNAWGKIETSPANNRHAVLQGAMAVELGRQLAGQVLTECPVLTEIGVRVPVVAWASAEFMRFNRVTTPYPSACAAATRSFQPAAGSTQEGSSIRGLPSRGSTSTSAVAGGLPSSENQAR